MGGNSTKSNNGVINHRRNSMDEPLKMLSDFIRREEEFIALYDKHYHELQEIIKALSHLINTFEKDFRQHNKGARDGKIVGIVGGVATVAGLVLAPFTLGASVAVASVGAGMAIGGGVSNGVLNSTKTGDQKKLMQNSKNKIEEFQKKITPMTDILKAICTHIIEILRENGISGLIKCAANASGILRPIRINNLGQVAAQASKTVCLTTTLKEVLAEISLLLNSPLVNEDNKILNDMDKLAGNCQISESEMESTAGKFTVKMRKVINQLKNIMDELKKTKDKIEDGWH